MAQVYRGNTTEDPYITYTTTLFDLHHRTAAVYTGRATDVEPSVILDLGAPLAWPRQGGGDVGVRSVQ